MLRNYKLTKSISDVSWSSFVIKLQYKTEWYGREIIKKNGFFLIKLVQNSDTKMARNFSISATGLFLFVILNTNALFSSIF